MMETSFDDTRTDNSLLVDVDEVRIPSQKRCVCVCNVFSIPVSTYQHKLCSITVWPLISTDQGTHAQADSTLSSWQGHPQQRHHQLEVHDEGWKLLLSDGLRKATDGKVNEGVRHLANGEAAHPRTSWGWVCAEGRQAWVLDSWWQSPCHNCTWSIQQGWHWLGLWCSQGATCPPFLPFQYFSVSITFH